MEHSVPLSHVHSLFDVCICVFFVLFGRFVILFVCLFCLVFLVIVFCFLRFVILVFSLHFVHSVCFLSATSSCKLCVCPAHSHLIPFVISPRCSSLCSSVFVPLLQQSWFFPQWSIMHFKHPLLSWLVSL